MKRIEPLGATLEACVTRCGTVVGPLLTELVGAPELTPYRGGWCGNEVFAGAFDAKLRATARRYTQRLGDQLYAEGYRGYFDCDYLIDRDGGDLYLGELNPRICGASPLTNHAAFAYADAPLFLFHLLEFSGVDFDLDVDESTTAGPTRVHRQLEPDRAQERQPGRAVLDAGAAVGRVAGWAATAT